MTSSPRLLAAFAGAALLFALTACSPAADPEPSASAADTGDCAGVTVVVDTGDLEVEDDPSASTCVDSDGPIIAADALDEAGVTTEGTTEYGDQVVCRVNGVPAEDFAIEAEDGSDYFETCETMPAAFAYWSVWVQPADGEWAYAEEGLSTLELEPGESVALLFTLDGEPASPTS